MVTRLLCLVSLFAGFCFLTPTILSASDEEANSAFTLARQAEKDQNYSEAIKQFKAAKVYADDPVLKTNALLGAARAYRKKELYGEEFDCLQTLLKEHINRVDFSQLVDRQYEIADAYFAGHRDKVLSWIPFLTKDNRCIEIYEAALKNGPCSDYAPNARLRLARLYIDEKLYKKAVAELKETMKLYPDTEEARYAFFELLQVYLIQTRRGDGDGAWAKIALDAMEAFLLKYPNEPESDWVKKSREEIRSTMAKRLHGLGDYYHRIGKDELAERYLAKVVRDYANSTDSIPSEKLLAKIDKEYKAPPPGTPRQTKAVPQFQRSPIPVSDGAILIVPENSDGKWLLPIRDLSGDLNKTHEDSTKKGPITDDDI